MAYEILESSQDSEADLRPRRPPFSIVVYDSWIKHYKKGSTAASQPLISLKQTVVLPERIMNAIHGRSFPAVDRFEDSGDDDVKVAP
ncbi:hypothetical protein Ct61P_01604 [Colletotrichum tofieldiae]|nr:hypothetical protein Ct61P_01604 [Colletotrichum tofieldiae]